MARHELTEEERARGQRAGGFAKAQKARERKQRAEEKAEARLVRELDKSVLALIAVRDDPAANPRDRADASKYLIDRIMGKATERSEVKVDDYDQDTGARARLLTLLRGNSPEDGEAADDAEAAG